MILRKMLPVCLLSVAISTTSPAQSADSQNDPRTAAGSAATVPDAPTPQASQPEYHGLVSRSVRRTLQDQKEIWSAPFKPKNLKWDALFLAGTAALIATDRHTAGAVSNNHVNAYRNMSNISITGLGITAGGLWIYGMTSKEIHANETGQLELESLVNSFLVYTPMQFAAGRERPTEGTGNGRFWRHAGFNTSFPAGHPMFAMTMATVIGHEYPHKWVQILAYGAATSVAVGRFGARMHFPSDIFVGSTLGYLISTHIFHKHCEEGLSEACHN